MRLVSLLLALLAVPAIGQSWRDMNDRYAVVGIIGGGGADGIAVIHDKQRQKNVVVRQGQKLGDTQIKILKVEKKFVVVGTRRQRAKLHYDSFATHSGRYAKSKKRSGAFHGRRSRGELGLGRRQEASSVPPFTESSGPFNTYREPDDYEVNFRD